MQKAESLKKKLAELDNQSEKELLAESLIALQAQNDLQRKQLSALTRINRKMLIFFWVFVAYMIFATLTIGGQLL